MKIYRQPSGHWSGSKWMLLFFTALLGCNAPSQPLASGKVQLPAGVGFTFDGDTLELQARDKPTQVAFGQLAPDGSFKVESLVDGQIVSGAPAGSYKARLVVSDDDYQHKAQAQKVIPKKYFSFETSALTVDVPSNDIQLTISK